MRNAIIKAWIIAFLFLILQWASQTAKSNVISVLAGFLNTITKKSHSRPVNNLASFTGTAGGSAIVKKRKSTLIFYFGIAIF
jgi:acyl-CoA reductase-like NAD-dependent aldehyde dehydrogenase